jgi:UDP-N-acetylmuramoyl-L-alanyl-D-glutamate--2,6-diaminopimelate ligase
MLLSNLLNSVEVRKVIGELESIDVGGIINDSRQLKSGDVFVAIKGYKLDGHDYIEEVIARGASVIVLEEDERFPDELFTTSNVVKILVSDSRKALSQLSYSFYGKPSHKLKLIGITGTKGKTTTGFIIKHLLESTGEKVGLIGTIANYIGDQKIDTKLTTPESNEIHKLLAEMVQAECTYCVMEVSSHALELCRVDALQFDFALFTNITSDHFDFHENFENYLNAKKRLFDLLSPGTIAVMNIDDENWSSLVEDSKAHSLFYGTGHSALYQINNIKYDVNGTHFDILFNDNRVKFSFSLIGLFNAYNATAAITIAHQLGLGWVNISDALKNFPQVPGRFEVIEKNDKKVIIDYSHTSDSLKKTLEALNELVQGKRKIYTVFGCGGERDKSKRPEMGKIAEQASDQIIITSDNPRNEDPYSILEDIASGLQLNNNKKVENREEAIKEAIVNSEKDAVILIAGKGHEDYQEINGVRHPFSDKEKAEKYLALC